MNAASILRLAALAALLTFSILFASAVRAHVNDFSARATARLEMLDAMR